MFSAAFLMIRDISDRNFMENLCQKHEQMMFSIAFNILHNSTDAEDAVQNTIVKLINSLEKIRAINDNETEFYISVMVKNAAYDLQRKLNRLPESNRMREIEETEADYSVEDSVLMQIDYNRVKTAISLLSDDDYEILFMYLIMGYSPSEIAEQFGVSSNTARQRIYRAKKHLKNKLEKEGITNDI